MEELDELIKPDRLIHYVDNRITEILQHTGYPARYILLGVNQARILLAFAVENTISYEPKIMMNLEGPEIHLFYKGIPVLTVDRRDFREVV